MEKSAKTHIQMSDVKGARAEGSINVIGFAARRLSKIKQKVCLVNND